MSDIIDKLRMPESSGYACLFFFFPFPFLFFFALVVYISRHSSSSSSLLHCFPCRYGECSNTHDKYIQQARLLMDGFIA